MAEENDEDVRKPVFHPGPWHIVQATIEKDETWGVNGTVLRIEPNQIVAFMLTDSAMHFVGQKRALDLGVWNTIDEFNEALVAEQARIAKKDDARSAEKGKRNGKGRHQDQAREQGQAAR